MSIRVTCEKCGVVLKVKEELAGTKGKCPACKGTLNVPTLEQAAQAAPLAATETAAAAGGGDTGALKIPSGRTRASKVAATPDEGPAPPIEANGSATKHASAAEASTDAPKPPRSEARPPESPRAPLSESTTDDLSPPAHSKPPADAKAKPRSEGKPKLRMSDTDAEGDAPSPIDAESPKTVEPATPAAEVKPPVPTSDEPARSGGGEFDLDSFLMEGPKPKALPPVPEEGTAKKGPAPRGGGGRKLSMADDETNVSGPSETLPPPNRGRGSTAESAMAALTGGGGTATSAKDLLAKASQEGRARASQMPDEKRERFDYAGAIKTIGKEFGPHVVGTIALCLVLYFGMNYMLGSNVELPPLARVYGTVTLKKQPVAGVVVNFTPIGSKDSKDSPKLKKGAPRPATALTDKDGKYELMYMEGVRGAVIGQNRVWIEPFSPENFKKIPGKYQKAETSGDIREVKETGGEENIEL